MTAARNFVPELDRKHLALALIQAVRMWGNPQYQTFLKRTDAGELTEDWFRWFVGSWKVARCIKDGCQTPVRQYLDRDFRQTLPLGDDGACVDAASLHIQRQGWSSRGGLPLSLVSKVAFFLRPNRFVPLDRFSLQGLNRLRAVNGASRLKGNPYKAYLDAFDEHYTRLESLLKAALEQPWAVDMADQLDCPRAVLSSLALRRKLFDDYLMHSADYSTGA